MGITWPIHYGFVLVEAFFALPLSEVNLSVTPSYSSRSRRQKRGGFTDRSVEAVPEKAKIYFKMSNALRRGTLPLGSDNEVFATFRLAERISEVTHWSPRSAL